MPIHCLCQSRDTILIEQIKIGCYLYCAIFLDVLYCKINGDPLFEGEENKMETEDTGPSKEEEIKEIPEEEEKKIRVVNGLESEQIGTIIRCSVGLIGIPVDPDALHAVLRLSLRLTRQHQFALQFAELGGPKLLLGLTQASAFHGFTSLATLLLRHILEEPNTLTQTLEKVVRSACQGTGSSISGVAQGSIGAKEMNYVLRVLGPVACRCPELFIDITKRTLRIALPPPSKRGR